MSAHDEMSTYENVKVSSSTGETDSYDEAVFPQVIRSREINLIKNEVYKTSPTMILDYGCGGGWLSWCLSRWGYDVVGVDISLHMVRNAKRLCQDQEFVICDVHRLPFKENSFDFVIGISILHHLNLEQTLRGLRQTLTDNARFLFMEPNILNPLSALGRHFFPMDAHTTGEKPFIPSHLSRRLMMLDFSVEKCFSIFFFSLPLARLFKISKAKPPQILVSAIHLSEDVFEKVPLLRSLNSSIVAIGKNRK